MVVDFQGTCRWWFQFFSCSPVLGEMIQFDEHLFQMGWFNLQLDMSMYYDKFASLQLLLHGPFAK